MAFSDAATASHGRSRSRSSRARPSDHDRALRDGEFLRQGTSHSARHLVLQLPEIRRQSEHGRARGSGLRTQVARNTVFCDAVRPSRIVLPWCLKSTSIRWLTSVPSGRSNFSRTTRARSSSVSPAVSRVNARGASSPTSGTGAGAARPGAAPCRPADTGKTSTVWQVRLDRSKNAATDGAGPNIDALPVVDLACDCEEDEVAEAGEDRLAAVKGDALQHR